MFTVKVTDIFTKKSVEFISSSKPFADSIRTVLKVRRRKIVRDLDLKLGDADIEIFDEHNEMIATGTLSNNAFADCGSICFRMLKSA